MVADPDGKGFRARCVFVAVGACLKDADHLESVFAAPQDRWWGLRLTKNGIFFGVRKAPGQKVEAIKDKRVSETWRLLLKDEVVAKRMASEPYPASMVGDASFGYNWYAFDYSLQQVTSEQLARALDSIVVGVEMRYLDPEEEE